MALPSSTWLALLGVICSGCGPRPSMRATSGPSAEGGFAIRDVREGNTPPARCESLFRHPIAPMPAMVGSGDPQVGFGKELLSLHDISGDDRWSPPVREHASYAWSSDETRVVSVTGSHDGPVELFVWDVRTGAALAMWPLPSSLAHLADLAVAPDEGAVAMLALDAQKNTRLAIVDLANGRVTEFGPTQQARNLRYATNGQRILVHDRDPVAASI
ncbi:hypothetical protein LVJ94_50640 [Pendulispora rubella]|uniref:Uncharacterized protein n=1 Tax=Pendulispora rubella TaxID=2741070 RepID=A0ABZ2L8T9_9BACT